MLSFDGGDFIPIMVFAIPMVAIVGGITAGIIRTLARHRMLELAQRERIAAIERGIDPAKLPPLPALMDDIGGFGPWGPRSARQRSQGLMIGGIITLFAGIGVSAFLLVLRASGSVGDEPVWAVGLIPGFVGAAMLLSSWLVRPHDGPNGGA